MRFSKINIEITNVCNLQCSFCPEVVRDHQMMDPDFFRAILEQAAPLTDQVALHLMGDPLVHPRFGEFIAHCEAVQTPVYLVTNGVLLREAHEAALLSPIVRQVNFSLHSFFDNFPERDPTPYLERIFAFTERALQARSDLFINYRLWNLSSERGGAKRNHEMLAHIGSRFSVDDLRARVEGIDVKRHKGVRVRERLWVHADTEFTWPSMDLPFRGESGTCYGLSPRGHFGILADGTVVPCCLDKEAVIALGNLKETALVDVLSSPRAQAISKGFSQNRLVEPLCQRCPYIERFHSA